MSNFVVDFWLLYNAHQQAFLTCITCRRAGQFYVWGIFKSLQLLAICNRRFVAITENRGDVFRLFLVGLELLADAPDQVADKLDKIIRGSLAEN